MQPQLDPVSVMVTLMAAVLSPAVSAVLGPYAVILLAATTGAAWSLGRREPSTKASALWFFMRVNMTAFLLTWSIVQLVMKVYALDQMEWAFAMVAFGIGLVGDEWPAVRRWLADRLTTVIDRRAASSKERP